MQHEIQVRGAVARYWIPEKPPPPLLLAWHAATARRGRVGRAKYLSGSQLIAGQNTHAIVRTPPECGLRCPRTARG